MHRNLTRSLLIVLAAWPMVANAQFFKGLQKTFEEAVNQVSDQSPDQATAGQGPKGTFSESKLHGFFSNYPFDGTVNTFPRVSIGFPDGETGWVPGALGPNQDWVSTGCWTVDATIWWSMDKREDVDGYTVCGGDIFKFSGNASAAGLSYWSFRAATGWDHTGDIKSIGPLPPVMPASFSPRSGIDMSFKRKEFQMVTIVLLEMDYNFDSARDHRVWITGIGEDTPTETSMVLAPNKHSQLAANAASTTLPNPMAAGAMAPGSLPQGMPATPDDWAKALGAPGSEAPSASLVDAILDWRDNIGKTIAITAPAYCVGGLCALDSGGQPMAFDDSGLSRDDRKKLLTDCQIMEKCDVTVIGEIADDHGSPMLKAKSIAFM